MRRSLFHCGPACCPRKPIAEDPLLNGHKRVDPDFINVRLSLVSSQVPIPIGGKGWNCPSFPSNIYIELSTLSTSEELFIHSSSSSKTS